MYLYLIPLGGINDILWVMYNCIEFCKKHNRILLLDTINSTYKINFKDYFSINLPNIIYDIDEIKTIVDKNITVYPNYYTGKLLDILNGVIKSTCHPLLHDNVSEDIIFCSTCGGGPGYEVFKDIKINSSIGAICREKINLLTQPYLSIQIRNTDYKCDYQQLYYENKDLIHSYNCVYIATDDKNVLSFFSDKKLNIFNFTTFPDGDYFNLQLSDIDPHIKIIDLLTDIYVISLSDKVLSNSMGGFIQLVRRCNANKNDIILKYQ
jgi:hypothetical protein